MATVASFDVFETLLVRKVGAPEALFLLLGRRLCRQGVIASSAERFARERRQAEQRAEQRHEPCDPSLEQIHAELAHHHGWSARQRAMVLDAELQLEADLLVGFEPGIERLARARRAGRRIVFVSDTYFPGAFVERQLRHAGLWEADDLLFASCEHGTSKFTHTLLPAVAQHLGHHAELEAHVGNDLHADVAGARAAGVRGVWLQEGNLNRYEQALERHRFATEGLSSVFAGASRLARSTGVTGRDAVIADVTAGVAAPIMTGFVLWVLHQARRRGVQRLYFLSRDGQLLHELASRLAPRLGIDIESRYLYSSRQALNLAALEGPDEHEVRWTLTHADTNPVRTILRRVGLEVDEVGDELRRLHLHGDAVDRPPTPEAHAALLATLSTGPLADLVARRAAERREVVDDYLAREGFYDPVEVGVVDLSGAGSQLRALHALRRRRGDSAPANWLFLRSADHGMHAGGPGEGATTRDVGIDSYFEDAALGLGFGEQPGMSVLLEVFCAADHGTVVDYTRIDGRVQPQLAAADADAERWGLPLVRDVLRRFVDVLVVDDDLVGSEADVRPALAELVELLWESPTDAEARTWGAFPFEGASGQQQRVPLAEPVSYREFAEGLGAGGLASRHWFTWRAASAQLSPPFLRTALRAARRARRLPAGVRWRLRGMARRRAAGRR